MLIKYTCALRRQFNFFVARWTIGLCVLMNCGYTVKLVRIRGVLHHLIHCVLRKALLMMFSLKRTSHSVFFKNPYTDAYRTDERGIRQIKRNNVRWIKPNDSLKLVIYYKITTIKGLVSKNNHSPPPSDVQKTKIYEFIWQTGECEHLNNTYIDVTTTSLSRRLTLHKGPGVGSPVIHHKNAHNVPITRNILVNNT